MKPLRWIVRLAKGPNWQVLEQAQAQPEAPLELPLEVVLDGKSLLVREVAAGDDAAILEFAHALPPHDLLFLRRDITDPEQVAQLLQASQSGLAHSLLVWEGDKVVGYASVASDGLAWTRHVRELRVLVAASWRGKHLGRLLTEQAFAMARADGAAKMVAQMTVDQEAAVNAFRRIGFVPEARLQNHVIDRDGKLHDLQIMSLDVDKFQVMLELALAPEPMQI
jgi:L-amino acid N-acyltransferase YncA